MPEALTKSKNSNSVTNFIILTLICFVLLYLEILFITGVSGAWSDPLHASGYMQINSRLGELIGFALAVVMSLYIIVSTVSAVVYLSKKKFQTIHFQILNRIHTLVLVAFAIHFVLFLAIFYRP